jgi:hypothetical protein
VKKCNIFSYKTSQLPLLIGSICLQKTSEGDVHIVNRGKSVFCAFVFPSEGMRWALPFEIQLVIHSEFEFKDVDFTCNSLALSNEKGLFSRSTRCTIEAAITDIQRGQFAPLIETYQIRPRILKMELRGWKQRAPTESELPPEDEMTAARKEALRRSQFPMDNGAMMGNRDWREKMAVREVGERIQMRAREVKNQQKQQKMQQKCQLELERLEKALLDSQAGKEIKRKEVVVMLLEHLDENTTGNYIEVRQRLASLKAQDEIPAIITALIQKKKENYTDPVEEEPTEEEDGDDRTDSDEENSDEEETDF